MKAIEIMNEEHGYILRMLKVVRKACFGILQGDDINYDNFNKILDFISNYADKHHHKKEEDILFKTMVEHLGEIAEKTVNFGMRVEHDYGRLYVINLRKALENLKSGDEEAKLDIIANAISYTHLLERHIQKEDTVIYKFAERELNESVANSVDLECDKFELKNADDKKKYLAVLEDLEETYQ